MVVLEPQRHANSTGSACYDPSRRAWVNFVRIPLFLSVYSVTLTEYTHLQALLITYKFPAMTVLSGLQWTAKSSKDMYKKCSGRNHITQRSMSSSTTGRHMTALESHTTQTQMWSCCSKQARAGNPFNSLQRHCAHVLRFCVHILTNILCCHRLPFVRQLAERWQGPISLAVYIPEPFPEATECRENVLRYLKHDAIDHPFAVSFMYANGLVPNLGCILNAESTGFEDQVVDQVAFDNRFERGPSHRATWESVLPAEYPVNSLRTLAKDQVRPAVMRVTCPYRICFEYRDFGSVPICLLALSWW